MNITYILFGIIGIIILIFIIGKVSFSLQFDKQVESLFTQSKNISDKKFIYKQLAGLPEPVQRYFKYVLKEGQPYISYVRLTHYGKFKTDLKKKWMAIKGEQYFTTEKPGYIWKGATSMFTARDFYISDRGGLIVTLLSLFNMVNGKGEAFDQGELLRWLVEGVWFPTNLLPHDRLKWSVIDEDTAGLIFNYKGLSLYCVVSFNAKGEITRVETKRYISEGKLETWIGKLNVYKEMNGILVPTDIEAIWELGNVEYPYAKFVVKKIEYEHPEKF